MEDKYIYPLILLIITILAPILYFAAKSALKASIEKAISTAFEKNMEQYRNKLTRSTMAYELLLNKELDFYKSLDPILAKLIVVIQDINDYCQSNELEEQITKNNILDYLELIPEIKQKLLESEAYIPDEIFQDATNLVMIMQKDLRDLFGEIKSCGFESLKDKKDDIEILERCILAQTALLRLAIKSRLDNLAFDNVTIK